MRVLDLFSGLGGWSQAFKDRGHEVVRVEMNPKQEAEIHADIFDLTAADLAGPWDIILASPPCEAFSVAAIGKNWRKNGSVYEPQHPRAWTAQKLVGHTLSLIRELEPLSWIMENPRGMLRKLPVVAGLERRTVTYCHYGEERMKPTDLWGGFPWALVLHPACRNGDPCHTSAPRGSNTGTQGIKGTALRAIVPYALSLAVCEAMEKVLASGDRPMPANAPAASGARQLSLEVG